LVVRDLGIPGEPAEPFQGARLVSKLDEETAKLTPPAAPSAPLPPRPHPRAASRPNARSRAPR
jgi:hypothetical protein